ncbi:MAG: replication initiator protein A [Thiotrichales bacterium]
MVCEISKNDRSPLLPDRYPQGDLFVCDILDAAPKGDAASMEHPVFSLSTKPDTRSRRYDSPDGKSFVEIKPSVDGLATVHDRDILIYCISQLMAGKKDGRKPSKTLTFKAHDFLKATNRKTNGQAYAGLKAAFERLRGTTISTNITTGGVEQLDVFGLIDRARIIRETREGRMQEVEITLSDWLLNAVKADDVLTLNRQYFRIRSPLARRMYELARKHCGQQKEWKIGLAKLHMKTGSGSTPKEFKRLVCKIIEDAKKHELIPDYKLELLADVLFIRPKPEFTNIYNPPEPLSLMGKRPLLAGATIDKAREIAKGWCPYAIEDDWHAWMAEGGMAAPDKPDAAYLGFVKKWVERRGSARK